jgi:colanic acid/amylovoran biosynthesis protein
MIQMTDKSVGETYPRQVADIIEYCQTKGLRPYLLLHEGIRDLKLAEEINQMLSKEVMIYQYPDAKDIKGVISTARFVVSSRFHGIVSALSQGVPAIATGWSHKYQMLMEDYKCTQLLIDDDNSDVNAIIDLLADEESYGSIKSKIDAERILLKKQVSSMWDEVISLMKS